MFYFLALLSSLLFGLVVLGVGIALLLTGKNKLVGLLAFTVGLVTSSFSIVVFLFLLATRVSAGSA